MNQTSTIPFKKDSLSLSESEEELSEDESGSELVGRVTKVVTIYKLEKPHSGVNN